MVKHFFIVGAQRCGTTCVREAFGSHPEIEMAEPVLPEPKFFLSRDAGPERYAELFTPKAGALVRGEKTVSYMESEQAARRIAARFPDAKILIMLRDPVERALSHYRFNVRNEMENLPLDLALKHENRPPPRAVSMPPFWYVRRGQYWKDIARWVRLFGRESVRLELYELLDDSSFREMCLWLGVSAPEPRNFKPRERSDSRDRALLLGVFDADNLHLSRKYGVEIEPWIR